MKNKEMPFYLKAILFTFITLTINVIFAFGTHYMSNKFFQNNSIMQTCLLFLNIGFCSYTIYKFGKLLNKLD